MKKLSANEQYAAEIYDLLIESFDDENEDKRWDLNTVDATAWFTGLIKASALMYNRLTEDDKNYIEWTHLAQNLLIQDMMEKQGTA